MKETYKDLPEECWDQILSRLDHHQQWESLSLVSKTFLSVINHMRTSLKVINPSIEVLSKQLQRFPRLKKFDLSDISKSLEDALYEIALSGVDIEELNISQIVLRSCSYVSQTALSFATENTHSLRSLIFAADFFDPIEFTNPFKFSKRISTIDLCNVDISDDLLYEMAKSDLLLVHFHLRRCRNFTLNGIYVLLNAYQSLQSFTLTDTYILTDESMMNICLFIRKLISINLDGCDELTAASFDAVSSACPRLEHLRMDSLSTRNDFDVISCASGSIVNPCLTYAALRGHMLSGVLHTLPNLQFLKVHHFSDSCELDIAVILKYCRGLRQLVILGAGKFKVSEEISKLECLSLERSQGTNDQMLEMLGKRCQRLLYLNLTGCCNVTERGLRAIVEHCKQLRYINLDWCHQVNPSFISWMVSSCPSLRKIVSTGRWGLYEDERQSFLRQGCLVIPASASASSSSIHHQCTNPAIILTKIQISLRNSVFNNAYWKIDRSRPTKSSEVFDRSNGDDDRRRISAGLYDVSQQACSFFSLFLQTDVGTRA
ncbi:hypothetical protein SOVF_036410 isoform A [Spinacia oleracea]|nr:hypothetical protein SOVF_036410 isoform A [Spinacia oleracea]